MKISRYDRLRRSRVFRGGKHGRWRQARIGVIGVGMLGGPLAVAIARSGANVLVIDPEQGRDENLGTQIVRVGEPKATTVASACNAIRRGSAEGVVSCVRRVGPGALRHLDVIWDCTDDGTLAFYLTELSNGLGITLLRLAVDGSGEREMGRIRCSAGGAGEACQICGHDAADLLRSTPRTPCPDASDAASAPTLAGGALGMTIAGAALLQLQRLVTGNDVDLVLNREIVIDWSIFEILVGRIERSEACLSGHVRWRLVDVPAALDPCTLGDLFRFCRQLSGRREEVTIEPFGHSVCTEARCPCGAVRMTAGTIHADPPACDRCGEIMLWRAETGIHRLTAREAGDLAMLNTPLLDLGFPAAGALFVARAPHRAPLHLLLDGGPEVVEREDHAAQSRRVS